MFKILNKEKSTDSTLYNKPGLATREQIAAMSAFEENGRGGVFLSLEVDNPEIVGGKKSLKYFGDGPIAIFGVEKGYQAQTIVTKAVLEWQGASVVYNPRNGMVQDVSNRKKTEKSSGECIYIWRELNEHNSTFQQAPNCRRVYFNPFDCIRWDTPQEETDIAYIARSVNRTETKVSIDALSEEIISAAIKKEHYSLENVSGIRIFMRLEAKKK